MQTYLKTKPVWTQFFLFIGMAVGLFMIATVIGVIVLSKITGISILDFQSGAAGTTTNPAYLTYMRGLLLLQFLFLFVAPALIFAYLSDRRKPWQYLGLQQPTSAQYWLMGVAVLVVVYPFVEYIGYWNQQVPMNGSTGHWMKQMEQDSNRQIAAMLSRHTPWELVKNLLFVSLFAGIGEELFFRGILQRMAIRATKNPWMGIVLTATIFSAIHLQFYGFFPRLLLGILLGAIYWYSGSLLVAMLCHFLYDAVVIVAIYNNPAMLNADAVMPRPGAGALVLAIVSAVVTVALLLRMHKLSATTYDAVYSDDFPSIKNDFSF